MRKSRLVTGCMSIVTATMFLGHAMSASASTSTSSAPQLLTITIPAPGGEIPSKWLGYSGPPRANVLLPAGYSANTHYPLLVLLNGLANNYDSYAEDGVVAKLDSSRRDRGHAGRG